MYGPIETCTIDVKPRASTAPAWLYPQPPPPSVRDEGCFTVEHPGWRVSIYPDSQERHRLLVGDADDQCHEVIGAPDKIKEAYDLLVGGGALTAQDIVDFMRSLVDSGEARWV